MHVSLPLTALLRYSSGQRKPFEYPKLPAVHAATAERVCKREDKGLIFLWQLIFIWHQTHWHRSKEKFFYAYIFITNTYSIVLTLFHSHYQHLFSLSLLLSVSLLILIQKPLYNFSFLFSILLFCLCHLFIIAVSEPKANNVVLWQGSQAHISFLSSLFQYLHSFLWLKGLAKEHEKGENRQKRVNANELEPGWKRVSDCCRLGRPLVLVMLVLSAKRLETHDERFSWIMNEIYMFMILFHAIHLRFSTEVSKLTLTHTRTASSLAPCAFAHFWPGENSFHFYLIILDNFFANKIRCFFFVLRNAEIYCSFMAFANLFSGIVKRCFCKIDKKTKKFTVFYWCAMNLCYLQKQSWMGLLMA